MNLLLRDQIIFIERFAFMLEKGSLFGALDALNRITTNDFLKNATEIIRRYAEKGIDPNSRPNFDKTWYLKKNNPNLRALPVVVWALIDRAMANIFDFKEVLKSVSTYLKTELAILDCPKTTRDVLQLFNGISHLVCHGYTLEEILELLSLHIPNLKHKIRKGLENFRAGRITLHEIFADFDLPPFAIEALNMAYVFGTTETVYRDLIYHLILEHKIINQSVR